MKQVSNQKSIFNYNRYRAISSLVASIIMALLVFIGLMIRLFEVNVASGYLGLQAFRMFTIDSNFLVGICALLTIPYEIDGIRTGNYHMPRWIIYTLFVAISAVTMTFLIAITILAPVAGAYEMLAKGSSLFFHTLNPIVAIIYFIFIACDHKISFKFTFIGMSPVIVYALIYMIMVFFIGSDNGGWKDHYKFGYYIPWPVTLILMLAISFGICLGLRFLHNLMHKKQKELIKKYYLLAFEFNCKTIEEAVISLAKDDKNRDIPTHEIIVPRRVISMLLEHYKSSLTKEELCQLYLREYLNED